MKYPREWERVAELDPPRSTNELVLWRLKVPLGWYVLPIATGGEFSTVDALRFLPDPNHEWELEDET